jgi:hypothetical protein
MIVIETMSVASAIGTIAPKARPALTSGIEVRANPNRYASATARAIVAIAPQPRAVPIARPVTSPIMQPLMQWMVALKLSRLRS